MKNFKQQHSLLLSSYFHFRVLLILLLHILNKIACASNNGTMKISTKCVQICVFHLQVSFFTFPCMTYRNIAAVEQGKLTLRYGG